MKKAISFLLVLAVFASFCCISVFAVSAPFTVEATQSGDTVTVSVKTSQEISFSNFTLVMAADSAFTLTAINTGADYDEFGFGVPTSNTATGTAVMKPAAASSNNKTVAAGKEVLTFTYSGANAAAAGSYAFTLTVKAAGDYNGENLSWKGATASGNLTITAPAPTTGYGVALSSDVTEIAKDGAINLYLDVTHASETAFNAFYAVLTYDSAKVSYSGEATANGFTVDSSAAGTLKLSKTGANVTIGDSHELTLPFTANAAGEASFALTEAKVDKAANAETQNAPAATVTGSPLAVTVTETFTYSVTVTLGANMTSSGTLSQTGLTGAMTDVVVTPATGYALAAPTVSPADAGITATLDSTTGAYTISGTPTADVTVTFAAATVKAPTATSSAYFTGYTLIAATIEAEGYVPTYDGNAMFKVSGTGYDADTYYYVAAGDYDATKLGSTAGTATTVTKSADVNQTGVVDINDAQFVYNIYNGTAPTTNVVQRLLLADVNGDKTVNVSDCAVVVAAIG